MPLNEKLDEKLAQLAQKANLAKDKKEVQIKKGSLTELISKKEVLLAKINNLKELLSSLESVYDSANNQVVKIKQFKDTRDSFQAFFLSNKDSLESLGIESLDDLLISEHLGDEVEVNDMVAYQKDQDFRFKGKKIKDELTPDMENLADLKKQATEALPTEKLSWRGGKNEDTAISARQESLTKIKNYIQTLERTDLENLDTDIKVIKSEQLPILQKLITEKILSAFPEGNWTHAPQGANINFISQEIFELAGDELWPDVKQVARISIQEAYEKKGFNNQDSSTRDIEQSLEAEKLIFDVDKLRTNHEKLLKLDQDKEHSVRLVSEINKEMFVKSQKATIEDSHLYPEYILDQVNYFKEKNETARQACEAALLLFSQTIENMEKQVKTGWLTGKLNKEIAEKFQEKLNTAKKQLTETQIPEYFYQNKENKWAFINQLTGIINPIIHVPGAQNWTESVKTAAQPLSTELEKIKNLFFNELTKLDKLSNEIYNFNRITADNRSFPEKNGFKVPAVNLKNLYNYQSIFDHKIINDFFTSLNGETLNQEEFKNKFQTVIDYYEQAIASYPEADKIRQQFKDLLNKYETLSKDWSFSNLVATKMLAQKGHVNRLIEKESYQVKQDLFYSQNK